MKVMAVDPGISTGICVIEADTMDVVRLQTLYSTDLIEYFSNILLIVHPDFVVLERLPVHVSRELMKIVFFFTDVFSVNPEFKHYELYPGTWKPVAKAQRWVCALGTDQHQKDAYCIARYWIWTHHKELGLLR